MEAEIILKIELSGGIHLQKDMTFVKSVAVGAFQL